MAYEMLCGRPPIAGGGTPMAILLRVLNDEPVSPEAVNPSVDPALSDWILALLGEGPAAAHAERDGRVGGP